MDIIQTPYRTVLNLFYQIVKGIDDKIKNIGITICCFCLAAYFPLSYSYLLPGILDDENYRMLLICVLVALITIFGIRKQIDKMHWNYAFVIVFYLFILSILAARCHHGLRGGTVMFALFLLILLPAYSLVWNSHEQYDVLFSRLALAVVIVNIVFFVGSVIVWPYAPFLYEGGRYPGLTSNANIFAMVCLMTVICGCYLICKGRSVILSGFAIGSAFGLLLLTASRTAFLSVIAVIIVTIINYFRKKDVVQIGVFRIAISIIIALVMIKASMWMAEMPVKHYSYYGIESIKEETNSGSKYTEQECIERGIPLDGAQYETGVLHIEHPSMLEKKQPVRVEQIAAAEGEGLLHQRFQKNLDANHFSSGRLELYRWVIDHITVWGVDLDENPVQLNGENIGGTHNAVLNFAYQCGWQGGILFLLIEVMTGVFTIRFCFGNKEYPSGTLFAIVIIAAFLVEATLENQTLPSVRDLACYYYLIMPLMFFRGYHILKKKENEHTVS